MIKASEANTLTKDNVKSEKLQNHLAAFEKQIRKCALKGRYSAMWSFNNLYSQEFIDAFIEEVADAGYKIREHRYSYGETQIFVYWDDSVNAVKKDPDLKRWESYKKELKNYSFEDYQNAMNSQEMSHAPAYGSVTLGTKVMKHSDGLVEDLATGKSTNGVTL